MSIIRQETFHLYEIVDIFLFIQYIACNIKHMQCPSKLLPTLNVLTISYFWGFNSFLNLGYKVHT